MSVRAESTCCPGTDCCTETADPAPPVDADAVHRQVREGYAAIAKSGSWSANQSAGLSAAAAPAAQSGCCGSGSSAGGGGCCGATGFSPEELVAAIGYAQGDLASVPDGANMGLSCGNPMVIAGLSPGEVVLDLGSGGGFDCFIAGAKVGASGRVIGVDMTPEMVSRARANIAAFRDRTGLNNVEFRLGEIESLPVADASVDVVISNCVLNLSPDKPRVWREIARVLKPGGRVAVSDLALLQPLPAEVRGDVEALVGCIAGAVLVEEIRRDAEAAGLAEIVLNPKPIYVESLTDWQDPLYQRILQKLPKGTAPKDLITSLDISARKR